MEKDVLVSVIIPVFNVGTYIDSFLNSVIHQTYRNLEIIIIDDGSTDDSAAVCEKFEEADSRIVLVRRENKGLSAARNIGLSLMSGEVVVFCDPDDILHPDYVNVMLKTMKKNDSDIVVCGFTFITEEGKEAKKVPNKVNTVPPGEYNRRRALKALYDGRISNYAWDKMYDASLWRTIRFPEGHTYEDINTTFRAFDKCEKVEVINDALYYYRLRKGSISATCSRVNDGDWIRAWSEFDSFVEENIPTVFSLEQLKRRNRLELQNLISIYMRHSRNDGEEEKQFSSFVRNVIVEKGRRFGFGQGPFRKRVCYWMIRYCPRGLSMMCRKRKGV